MGSGMGWSGAWEGQLAGPLQGGYELLCSVKFCVYLG